MVKKVQKECFPPIFKDLFFSNFEANQGASSIKRKGLLKKQKKKVKFQIEYFFHPKKSEFRHQDAKNCTFFLNYGALWNNI